MPSRHCDVDLATPRGSGGLMAPGIGLSDGTNVGPIFGVLSWRGV